jgi:hypothetical protein
MEDDALVVATPERPGLYVDRVAAHRNTTAVALHWRWGRDMNASVIAGAVPDVVHGFLRRSAAALRADAAGLMRLSITTSCG